jgi:hypothetical protein
MASLGRWAVPLAILAAAAGLGGCDSSKAPETAPSPTISLQAPSSTPGDPDGAAVRDAVAAYRGMWDAYMLVLGAPDPDRPELARNAAGNALKALSDGVRDVRDRGLKGEGSFALTPQVTEIAPATSPIKIGIRDCFDDSKARIVRASPGPAYSDKPGGRRLCIATVERQGDGAWKVTSFGLHEVGTCT